MRENPTLKVITTDLNACPNAVLAHMDKVHLWIATYRNTREIVNLSSTTNAQNIHITEIYYYEKEDKADTKPEVSEIIDGGLIYVKGEAKAPTPPPQKGTNTNNSSNNDNSINLDKLIELQTKTNLALNEFINIQASNNRLLKDISETLNSIHDMKEDELDIIEI